MKIDNLKASVSGLLQPSEKSADEFSSMREKLVVELNNQMLVRQDLEQLIGSGNEEMMKTNSANMTLFMESIFVVFSPETLLNTVIWVFNSYKSHGFQPLYWATYLSCFTSILRRNLSDESLQEILPFFDWLIVNTPAFDEISNKRSNEDLHGNGLQPEHC